MELYCDGACSGNGKINAPGGAAWCIVIDDKLITQYHFHIPNATNNICELQAMIGVCQYVKNHWNIDEFHSTIKVYSDSAYIINCYKEKWYEGWQWNGWKTASRAPVKNKELWEQLIPFFDNPIFEFEKIAGHSGNKYNELVDKLAVRAKKGE